MEEKNIIKSEQYDLTKIKKTVFGIAIALVLVGVFLYVINFDGCRYREIYHGYIKHSIFETMIYGEINGIIIDIGVVVAILISIITWWLGSYKLTVTDKRIYGKTGFGKRVDLPVDSVTAVATSSLNGIAVATSSGKIIFKLIKNRDEVHAKISELIINRQNKPVQVPRTTIKQEIPQSSADELKKYKELLDMGVISQEEFDAKKKQLLGL